MIKSSTIYNELGEFIDLELAKPSSDGISVREITGLGPVKGDIHTVKVAGTPGVKVNSTSVGNRNLVFSLGFETARDVEEARQKTYKYFPVGQKVRVILRSGLRTVRTTGYVESNEPDIFDPDVTTKISIICEDAYFYDATDKGVVKTLFYAVEKNFEFPMENKSLTEKTIELGKIQTIFEKTVAYTGDVSVGVTITITVSGDLGDITVYNPDRNESIILKSTKVQEQLGQGFMAGDTITINTRNGMKAVTLTRGGVNYNIMNARDRSSAWLRFYRGNNKFAYAASYGSANMQMSIESHILYEGI